MVSAWKRMAASASTVEYTPHAPSHGSTRSSYWNPRTSNPFTNVSAQSLRLDMSASTAPIRSLEILLKTSSSKTSARLASKGTVSPMSALGISVISTEPSSRVTISGFTISISSALSSTASASRPAGAAYSPLSTAINIP